MRENWKKKRFMKATNKLEGKRDQFPMKIITMKRISAMPSF